MTQVRHRSTCRLCDSRAVELVVKLAPIPLSERYAATREEAMSVERYPIDVYMCRECGHVQQLDVIDSESLWADYSYESAKSPGMVEHFRAVARAVIEAYRPPSGSLVVDIGSNDGSLLRPFKDSGYRVLGIDPATAIAERATASGIETIAKFMSRDLALGIGSTHGRASVVCAFNAFAHADDMSEMVDCVREMLAPDGVFVFEAQYLLDIVDKALVATIFHEHMSHHSVTPLVPFLRRHGLELIEVQRHPVQHGSIIGVVQHVGGPHPVDKSVGEMLALEASRQLTEPQTLKDFSVRLDAMRSVASREVRKWRERGHTIAAYGAARSAPTLIAQMGLEGAIGYIVDDHPQKVSRYLPGEGIEIVPTGELCRRMPGYAVVLAWVHATRIVEGNGEYLHKGGKFVTLSPHMKVIGRTEHCL